MFSLLSIKIYSGFNTRLTGLVPVSKKNPAIIELDASFDTVLVHPKDNFLATLKFRNIATLEIVFSFQFTKQGSG